MSTFHPSGRGNPVLWSCRPGPVLYKGTGGPGSQRITVLRQERSIRKYGATISIQFTLGRRLLSSLMTVYVPTLLLNVIALCTNYFKVGIRRLS